MIPELPYSPLSPSEPGYSSPTESEALHTPYFPEQPHVLLQYPSHTPPTNAHVHGISHEIIAVQDPCKHRPMEEHNHLPSLLLDSLSNSTNDSPPLSPGQYSPIHDSTMPPEAYSSSLSPEIYEESNYHPSHSSSSSPSSLSYSTPAKVFHKSQNTYPPYSRPTSSPFNLESHLHSPHFPRGHQLNAHFVRTYQLEDELGSGGYGFVMTAKHRRLQYEVAVKFIIKAKVPEHAWMEHELYGRLPTEVMLLSVLDHENIIKCLDLFEDPLYFYLVQELHGSPWQNPRSQQDCGRLSPSVPSNLPALIPSRSADSLSSPCPSISSQPSTPDTSLHALPDEHSGIQEESRLSSDPDVLRPQFSRRPSHDLFECIEQSEHKRLSEDQARYVFAQVVDAVHYLDSQGVSHRDIKDENIVIDADLKVKLIDFGSATFVDPAEPRPYYNLFYGTTAYAASEILQKKPYQAAPAEVWTLGVLLSYLLTGNPPFPNGKDAIAGRVSFTEKPGVSRSALNLMRFCLDPDPKTRLTIAEIKAHPWLHPHA
uniref:Protein kinase domain-containing protein n=1 Tax=Moniliophthora roreri TaxID=221103 RepID=A0A0W0F5J9_MONRR